MMRRELKIMAILVCASQLLHAQKSDSLLGALARSKSDTARITCLNLLSLEYRKINIDSALLFARKAARLTEETAELPSDSRRGVYRVSAMNNMATCFAIQGNMDSAFVLFRQALRLNRERKDLAAISKSLNNLGNASLFAGKLDDALTYYLESLSLAEKLKLPNDIANTAGNIGIIYHRLGNKQEAIRYYRQSILTNEQAGHPAYNSEALVNLGLVYGDLGNDSLNMHYQQQALRYFEADGDKIGIARVYNNIALIYERRKDYEGALKYYFKAIETRKETGQASGNAITYHNIGLIYLHQGKPAQAIDYILKGREIGEQSRDYYFLKEVYHSLAMAYEKAGDFSKAYAFMQAFAAAKDSVYNETSSRQIAEMQTKYETEKRENEILLLKSKAEKDELLLQKRNLQVAGVALGSLLVLITGFLFFNRYRAQQKRQKELAILETRQKERMRIARDMHDDIGSGLTRISLASEQARMNLAGEGPVNDQLAKLSAQSQQLTRNLGEIIWTMNPKNDTLEGLCSYIRNYTYDFLDQANIACELDFPEIIPAAALTPEARRNVFMIVKEALNNIVKHAQATQIVFTLKAETRSFSFAIKDNGKGIDSSPGQHGNGLMNMKKRAEEMGASFTITTSPGNGTTLVMEGIQYENTTKV